MTAPPTTPNIEQMLQVEHAKDLRQMRPIQPAAVAEREFSAFGDDRYRLAVPRIGVALEIDRLRREHHELIGELSVRCGLPGARGVNGSDVMSVADLNLSSARARTDRAKLLATRANTRDLDWVGIVEDFCQRVLTADRIGQPAVDLRELPRPSGDDEVYTVEGLALPRRHPSILFGDGGTAKSYVALNFAGRIAEKGARVAFFDWELAGDDHRDRLERLFPDGMPKLLYCRCERPLVYEADRLRRIVRENEVQYSVYDSVAFASDGPPEAAEVAGRYFRAVRQIGGGSLHVAHVSKGENADQKPFGSAFWFNGARSIWYAKLAGSSADEESLSIGLFNRKSNLGRLRAPVGLSISFTEVRTVIRRNNVADSPDLAAKLSIPQRMSYLLRHGSMSTEAVAEEIEADVETVKRVVRRYKDRFTVLEGGRVGLLSQLKL